VLFVPADGTWRTVRFIEGELDNGYALPKGLGIEVTLGDYRYKAANLNNAIKLIRKDIIIPFLRKHNQKNFNGLDKMVIAFDWPRPHQNLRKDTAYMLGDYEMFCDSYYDAFGREVTKAGQHSFERHIGRVVNLELREISRRLGYGEPNYGKVISHALYRNADRKECELDVIAIANSEAVNKLAAELKKYGIRTLESVREHYHPDLACAKVDFSVLPLDDN
jgi:hypothetical protein